MSSRPRSITVALFFILLNAIIWLGFAIIVGTGAHPAMPNHQAARLLMTFLALATSIVLFVLFFFHLKRSRTAYLLTVVILLGITLLTIADEFGIADLIVVVLNIIPIILLIKGRSWYIYR